MMILTRSRRIRQALRRVQARMPAIVSRWGFRFQIRAMRHEQETFVLPLLYSREPQIMRLLEKRAREACERAEQKLLRWVKSRRKR